jgi:hypothetical protein
VVGWEYSWKTLSDFLEYSLVLSAVQLRRVSPLNLSPASR